MKSFTDPKVGDLVRWVGIGGPLGLVMKVENDLEPLIYTIHWFQTNRYIRDKDNNRYLRCELFLINYNKTNV